MKHIVLMLLGLVVGAVGMAEVATAEEMYSSHVEGMVTPELGGFRYSFEVFNDTMGGGGGEENGFGTPIIVNWELPLFSVADVNASSIASPTGWTSEIITPDGTIVVSEFGTPGDPSSFYNNPFGPYGDYSWTYDAATDPELDPNQGGDPNLYGPNPQVFENPPLLLHWFTLDDFGGEGPPAQQAPILPGDSLAGFSFLSDFSQQNAPYQASWFELPPTTGDPPTPQQGLGLPNSPARQAAQQVVPEPSSLAIWSVVAVGGLLTLLRRRRLASVKARVVDMHS